MLSSFTSLTIVTLIPSAQYLGNYLDQVLFSLFFLILSTVLCDFLFQSKWNSKIKY